MNGSPPTATIPWCTDIPPSKKQDNTRVSMNLWRSRRFSSPFVGLLRPSQILVGHSCCPQQVVSAVMRKNGEEDIISRTAQITNARRKNCCYQFTKGGDQKSATSSWQGRSRRVITSNKFNAATLMNVPSARIGIHPAFNVIRRPSSP